MHFVSCRWINKDPEAVACPDQCEERVANFITKLSCRYGMAKIFVHDNGKPLISSLNKKICARLGIKKHCVRPYRPQENGAAENGKINEAC